MRLRYYWVNTLMLAVFLTMLDHVVHSTLYDFGLQFDWTWYTAYGVAILMIFVFMGLRSAFLYYYNSEDPGKLKTSIALFVTDVSIWVGGYLDFLWFIMEGRIPMPGEVWFWMPQARLIPNYDILYHLVWVSAWTLGLYLLWNEVKGEKET